ncbi:MAG TPA: allophanate hydrolase, partial [Steroidobacteraceae bacterium]
MRWLTAASIAHEVTVGLTSAEAVACEALAGADDYDAIQPQAWISRAARERVIAAARAVDARVAAGEHLPLAGVPFAVKDNLDVAEMETTAACPAFAYRARESATVVSRLIDAGAVLIGKTNLDQFATGLTGARTPYGALGCVFNRSFVSGGSSSGSAVVVAAGIVPIALGSDTAGSGRVPAAFNGLTGFKPTRGRWSTRGLVPACRTLDCVTTFTTSAEDAAIVDDVLAAFDEADPYSRRLPAAVRQIGEFVRIGVPRSDQLVFHGDAEAAALFQSTAECLRRVGGTIVEIDAAPLTESGRLLYEGPWVAERTAVLSELLQSSPDAIHPVVRAIVQAGRGLSAVDAFRGFYALQEHAREAEAMWRGIDALLLPTAPTIYRLSEVLAEPTVLNGRLGLYTNFVNLLDMSAIAVPAGFRENGTGFGVSLIGPAWADRGIIDLARRLESAQPIEQPPLDETPRVDTVKLAVVGAHLAGMPLHPQLTSRGARLIARTYTAPLYRLYAMRDQTPPKPALVHVGPGGGSIELEVYELELAAFGSFVAEVPPPLAIGTVVLADGASVRGFVAEPRAIKGAQDITSAGGWRAYLAA